MMISNIFQNILITGGAGFIGSHMVDELLMAERKVAVFDNLTSGKYEFLQHHAKNPDFIFIRGDLLKKKELHGAFHDKIDTVIHLAANPDISKGIDDPSLDFNQTIVATFNLLMAMKEKNIKQLIYFSGSGVYGDIGKKYASEKFGPLIPVSMYGASKLSAEAVIYAFSHLFDIKTWIFRPANIVGNRATHGVVFDFLNKLKKTPTKLTILGDGKQSKSYLYIRDVLDAVWLATAKNNQQVNIFNIASKTFITVNEIAHLAIQQLNLKNVKIRYTGGSVGWPGDVPIIRMENKKLHDIDWKPKYTSREAVKQTIADLIKS